VKAGAQFKLATARVAEHLPFQELR
jgi:hypothetical protein